MKTQRFNSIRTRDDSDWGARISKARADRRAEGLDDKGLSWDDIKKEEEVILSLWEEIIRQRKYRLMKISVRMFQSGLQLIAQGRNRKDVLPMMGYKKDRIVTMGPGDAGIETHELKIDLPDEAGQIEIKLIPVPVLQVTVTPHITAAGNKNVTIERSKGETIPGGEDVPNHTRTSFALETGPYRIFIEWNDKTWEIPLEVQ